jgi:hypothetical protein
MTLYPTPNEAMKQESNPQRKIDHPKNDPQALRVV